MLHTYIYVFTYKTYTYIKLLPFEGFPGALEDKSSAHNAKDPGSIPG